MGKSLSGRTPGPLRFRDERATPALLEFLEDIRVVTIPGLALWGVVEEGEESELGEIELWPGAEDWEWLESEEAGLGPP